MRIQRQKLYWHQMEFAAAMARGCKRAFLLWHRRAGKDYAAWWHMVEQALQTRANYSYYFPTRTLGKQVIFEGIDPETGSGYLDGIPKGLIDTQREDEGYIRLINGSQIRIIGTDAGEVVGPNPYGVVFSEFALQNPTAWNYVRPILEKNGGWAVFTTTPRGDNHAKRLWEATYDNANWFNRLRTVWHTGLITNAQLMEMLNTGYTLDYILQEFFCDFNSAMKHAYWENEIRHAREEGRISPGKRYLIDRPVYASWDLGEDDMTAFWIWQYVSGKFIFLDYYESRRKDIEHYLVAMTDRCRSISTVILPFDARNRAWGTRNTPEQLFSAHGYKVIVLPRSHSVGADIETVRHRFPDIDIDSERCEKGVYNLSAYRPTYDEKKQLFSDKPMRGPANHGADAMRYGILTVELNFISGEETVGMGGDTGTYIFDKTMGGRVKVSPERVRHAYMGYANRLMGRKK